ncbi:MAG: AbrB/MazE/SpoVT family DNA-binding domain-containing protein [Candidatus Caldarchaeales archaeon]
MRFDDQLNSRTPVDEVKLIAKNSLPLVGMVAGASTVSEKGQVTIPKEVRELLGLRPGVRVLFVIEGDRVFMVKGGAVKVSKVLRRQRPWTVDPLEFQRKLRSEWP